MRRSSSVRDNFMLHYVTNNNNSKKIGGIKNGSIQTVDGNEKDR